jgi:hypothetical protein
MDYLKVLQELIEDNETVKKSKHGRLVLDQTDYSAIKWAAERIQYLEDRLEVNCTKGTNIEPYDGIACRDTTIKEQDKQLDKLKQENERLRKALDTLVDIVWNTATDSEEVPSTKWKDELVKQALGGEDESK